MSTLFVEHIENCEDCQLYKDLQREGAISYEQLEEHQFRCYHNAYRNIIPEVEDNDYNEYQRAIDPRG